MDLSMSQNETPKLAPPGAGIPFTQKLFLKLYLGPFVAAKTPWEKSKQNFEKITEKILKEVEGLNDKQLNQKILVPPQPGLEDSSRFWSIAMTLEHMVIVGKEIQQAVESLTHGALPNKKADIGKLKPHGELTALESVQIFKTFTLEEFPKIKIGDRNSKLKLLHPWFGLFSAQQWYWLLGAHQLLHLRQIREIKKRLS